MKERPDLQSTDQEIVEFVSSWVEFLSEHGYEAAIDLLDDPVDANRRKWSRDEWDRELACYGESAVISDPREVPSLRKDVYRYNDLTGFAVDFDLPVNGERSDHTLQFDFRVADGVTTVALDDLHVL